MPMISVVMSVYNAEEYLDESIQSILNQTYKNFEFIIINDGSTDKSQDIINKYIEQDNRIIVINRENKGLPYSLNEGIVKSKGNYIARMDADDISMSNRFEEQIKFMEENQDIGICGTFIESFGKNINNRIQRYPLENAQLRPILLFTSCFAHPTVMIRKSILDKFNLKYNEEYKNSQDYELWVRLSKYTKVANISKVLLKYRIVDSSITSKTDIDHFNRYILIKNIFSNILKELNIQNSEKENRLHFIIGVNNRLEKEQVDLRVLNSYFVKISKANKQEKVFDEKELIIFLSRKFLIVLFYQLKQKNYISILKSLKSRLLYNAIYYMVSKKWK